MVGFNTLSPSGCFVHICTVAYLVYFQSIKRRRQTSSDEENLRKAFCDDEVPSPERRLWSVMIDALVSRLNLNLLRNCKRARSASRNV